MSGLHRLEAAMTILVKQAHTFMSRRMSSENTVLVPEEGGNYTREFFERRQSSVNCSAEKVVPWLMDVVAPRSVIDVGCGTGGWLAAFERRGIAQVLGIDGEWIPQDQLDISPEKFVVSNLREQLSFETSFDLAICLEVAEHLTEDAGAALIRTLTAFAPVVFFSAAVPHQGGRGHINEQWPEYWINRFERENFVCVDCFRSRFWEDQTVNWWYLQNAFLFVSAKAAALERVRSEGCATSMSCRAVVHPRLWESRAAKFASSKRYSIRKFLSRLIRSASTGFEKSPF